MRSLGLLRECREAQLQAQHHDCILLVCTSLLSVLPARLHKDILLRNRFLSPWGAPSQLSPGHSSSAHGPGGFLES